MHANLCNDFRKMLLVRVVDHCKPNKALNEAGQCPNCGRPLSTGNLAGLCPTCLLAQGAETGSGAAPAPRFEPPSVEAVAKLFPQLEILGLVGAGGMGAVYKARQPVLDD